ncbi:MAG: hypothetical protein ACR2FV_09670 [Ornithinimicrobium sp.]|uniref:hypothetical protein n=1 Tax=Ornithinimicrobium sp. TaxID=1977084 RepID=UPI003D9B04D4
MTESPAPTPAQVRTGQLAGALVGVEAVALAGFAAFYLIELLRGEGSDPVVIIMTVVMMLIFVVGLGYVAYGLWTRHPRAQAPAMAANGLLVPLGIAMFQFAPVWLAGSVLLGAVLVIVSSLRMGQLD